MLALVALASALIAQPPADPTPADPAAVRRAYDDARSTTGRSSDDQVRLAYWCEAHGLTAERLRHLAQAVLADPTNAAARGLLGLVARDGRWLRPEAIATQQQADPKTVALLAEYDLKRSATPYKADAQFALGAWAEERGLKDQAKAHFTASARLDPTHDATWKRLGYTKHDGRWTTAAQLAAERADVDAQKAAERKWKPLFEKWKAQLARPSQRAEAEANLLTVTDPRAVPSVLKGFGGSEADQPRAVQLLGQIDSPPASRALASLAVFAKSAEARRVATETLRGRDTREYADLLISLIRDRIKYEVTPVGGPGSPGVLRVEGKKANINRVYAPPAPSLQPGDQIGYDPQYGPVVRRGVGGIYQAPWVSAFSQLSPTITFANGTPAVQNRLEQGLASSLSRGGLTQGKAIAHQIATSVRGASFANPDLELLNEVALDSGRLFNPTTKLQLNYQNQAQFSIAQLNQEAQKAAIAAQGQLSNDKATLDRINAGIDQTNGQVVGILRATTGLDFPEEQDPWMKWWVNLVGYRYNASSTDNKPTFVEQVPLGYQPEVQPIGFRTGVAGYRRISCFGAGTMVQTLSGPRAIETLAVGDLVLTQSTATGALGYQPILVTHHNPPSGTFRIKLGDDEIVSSDFHRFWVARRGWVMARNLQAGDPVRTLGGVVPVESVTAGKTELVYNLDVAEDADFFAGKAAALVHDNTLPDPRLVPFDLPVVKKEGAAR